MKKKISIFKLFQLIALIKNFFLKSHSPSQTSFVFIQAYEIKSVSSLILIEIKSL